MQRSGGAVILMKNNQIEYLFGSEEIQNTPGTPYEPARIQFLDEWSKAIRSDIQAKQYPDILTFAFWIRKANVTKLADAYENRQNIKGCRRLGKGLVFHIAPSNVPINFAYTFVFGLLSGNSNIVKVSSKRFIQTEILCRILNQLMEKEEHQWVQEQNAVVLYERNADEYTEEFSAFCDTRIIWGGDKTICQIRKSPLPPRSTELTFADRYSFAVLSAKSILEDSDTGLKNLAKGFYNDTYLMDQNACSSPHLICWTGEETEIRKASNRFWEAVYKEVVSRYDLADVKVSEKYTILCELADILKDKNVTRYENALYVVHLTELPEQITKLRGKFGLFFEYTLQDMEEICRYADKKVQTCAIYGVDAKQIADCVINNKSCGIDRIVPIGKTLDISMIWDGYDIVGELSRCISF